MGAIIGIDLGTTNSCVVVLDDGEPVVIPNAEGARTTPSVVAFADGEELLVGQQAKRQAAINPQRTVQQIKRLIGLRYDDPEVERFARIAGFDLVKHDNGDVWVRVGEQEWSPQEISALILRKLRSTAEDYLGQPVKEAVITVPAYFNDSQRQATRDAGRIAGLTVRRIINEPTAAALAYGVDRNRNATIAVFDLGGGTFDISILRIQDGLFEVISTAGDSHLGGEDIDEIIMDHLLEVFQKDSGIDIREDRMALQRIREAAETAKCELSTLNSTNVNLPFVAVNEAGPQHLNYVFHRSRLNDLCRSFIDRLSGPCEQALADAGLDPDALDEVILIGGMTRMPLVQEKVEALFGKKPGRGINPDEAVAIGAALQGAILGGEVREVVLLDVTPQHLGIRVQGNRMSIVIPRNTNIPVRESKVFTTTEDNQREVVLQVLQGNSSEANTNHRLGTFTLGGLEPRPAGEVRVEVGFAIDSDGIVEVSATDQSTGRSTEIRITHAHGLSRGEMDEARDRVSAIVSTDYGDVTSTFPSSG